MTEIIALAPRAVWTHFEALTRIPRGSGKEAQVSDFMKSFGEGLGLETHQDTLGNVIIRKPGTKGAETRPAVALQGHLDMVWNKRPDHPIDFESDPIRPILEGDWVRTEGTTLGADNGIGVAMAMAVLSSADLAHPPIEAVFTTDEEVGMSGAEALGSDDITAPWLINIDSEEDTALTIGCAGASDLVASGSYELAPLRAGHVALELSLSGGKGGHSGIEIDQQRLNAVKLLAEGIAVLAQQAPVQLVSFDVPGVANIIPAAGNAVLAVPQDHAAELQERAPDLLGALLSPFAETDPEACWQLSPVAPPAGALPPELGAGLIASVQACPNGVLSMSDFAEGLVESSNNLALLRCAEGLIVGAALVRSSIDARRDEVAAQVQAAFAGSGIEMEIISTQPAWEPHPGSPLQHCLEDAYEARTGRKPEILAIHAGLECGAFAANVPGLEMISLGPNIHGAHSPEERVQVSSVALIWEVLTEALAAMAKA